MVSGDRFYRRAETRTVKMSEPEIREVYNRISMSSLALEQALATRVREQEALVADACQSVMIVPWYARRGLMDPRALKDIGTGLVEGPFKKYSSPDYWSALRNIRAYANGLWAHINKAAPFDLFVTRDGVVHLADAGVLDYPYLDTIRLLENILVTLRTARLILDRCNYWGSVHVIQIVSVPSEARLQMDHNSIYHSYLAGGRHEQVVPEVNLTEQGHSIEPIARDLCDQLFQVVGATSCPLFNEDGSLREDVKRWGRL
jgi:hypothetical protein